MRVLTWGEIYIHSKNSRNMKLQPRVRLSSETDYEGARLGGFHCTCNLLVGHGEFAIYKPVFALCLHNELAGYILVLHIAALISSSLKL
jgi:hypothetical protein